MKKPIMPKRKQIEEQLAEEGFVYVKHQTKKLPLLEIPQHIYDRAEVLSKVDEFELYNMCCALDNLKTESDAINAVKISEEYDVNINQVVAITHQVGIYDTLMAVKFYQTIKNLFPKYTISIRDAYFCWFALQDKLKYEDFDAINSLEVMVLEDDKFFNELGEQSLLSYLEKIAEAKGEPVDDVATGYHFVKEKDLPRLEGVPLSLRDALQNYFNYEYDAEREIEREDPLKQYSVITLFPTTADVTEEEIEVLELDDVVRKGTFNPISNQIVSQKIPQHNLKSILGVDTIKEEK